MSILMAGKPAICFKNNLERMRYAKFRGSGCFVGSGVVETGCRTVVWRLKKSDMF